MRIHVHAALTAALTLALMVMGSLVHGTGSSLACPDWPLCHGTFFPEMSHGVQFEHTHRLMAAAVIVLIGTLAYRAARHADRRARALAFVACGLVLVQATLGGLTVIYKLPPAISIAHLGVSMAFLSLTVALAVLLAPGRVAAAGGARTGLAVVASLAWVQVVLGAAVRHTGAVLACTGFPLCTGEMWPEASLSRLQVVHRALGLVVLVATLVVCARGVRAAPSRAQRIAGVLPAIVAVLQVALGAAVVLTLAPLDLVTLHHLGGACLLASLVVAYGLHLRPAPTGHELRAAAQGAPESAPGLPVE